jgi:hypothetical protein
MIEQRDGKWCLLTKDGARVLGCHDTKDEAEAQERAIEARKNASQLHTLAGVEIFQAGKWNGDDYTVEDLDRMVEAAQQVGFTPPLKAGHADRDGQPALGWVENLRRVGSKLVADLVGLPARVYEAIRQRRYDRVSAEIYWNLQRNGKNFPRALKALALLGAEIPAVDLKPLHELFSMPPWPTLPAAVFHAYAIELEPPMPATVSITREQMAAVCPECVELMKAKKITALKLVRAADGAYAIPGGMSSEAADAPCEKFGGGEGFRTRCMEHMTTMDDPGAFCNALKAYCHGSVTAEGDRTPAKRTAMTKNGKADDTTDDGGVTLKDGEVIMSLGQLEEFKAKTARLEQLEAEHEKAKELEGRLAKVEDDRRRERIEAKVATLKVPAFRPFARAFYDLATHTDGAKRYTLADPKKPLSPEEIVDAWLTEMNRNAARLFQVLSVQPKAPADADEPEEASARVDYRVKKYLVAHPGLDYKKALRAVLDADPDLKQAYAAS